MSTPRSYAKAAPETWALIRGAYLSGLSAAVVARRFGVTESALRKRACREGWTKAALGRGGAPVKPPPRPAPNLDPYVLVRTALTEAAWAMADGKPWAARACVSAGEGMARLTERYPRYEDAESVPESEARHDYFMQACREMALAAADKLVRGLPLSPAFAEVEGWFRKNHGRAPGAPPPDVPE